MKKVRGQDPEGAGRWSQTSLEHANGAAKVRHGRATAAACGAAGFAIRQAGQRRRGRLRINSSASAAISGAGPSRIGIDRRAPAHSARSARPPPAGRPAGPWPYSRVEHAHHQPAPRQRTSGWPPPRPSTSAVMPVPRPSIRPPGTNSCHSCEAIVASAMPRAHQRERRCRPPRATPQRSIITAANRRHQAEQREAERERRGDLLGVPAELLAQRLQHRAGQAQRGRHGQHGQEGDRGDDPAVVDAAALEPCGDAGLANMGPLGGIGMEEWK